jgi:membrane protease subunit (stomatin/prohibitin family)
MSFQRQVTAAGIHVHSFGLKEISYSPVVAAAMLKRQQAAAMVQARSTIVQGAVEIASTAVNSLRVGIGLRMMA